MSLLSILALGFFLGIRHATDADHVVAVTTIVSQERSVRIAAVIGALWGIGHSITLFLVGAALVIFRLVIPPHLGLAMEMAVAVMLVVLGAANITRAKVPLGKLDDARRAVASHKASLIARVRNASVFQLLRALVVGVVHGLAGSAAIALLVLTTIPDRAGRVLYLGIFGVGSIFGMMCLTMAMAYPMALAADRFTALNRTIARATGLVSILFGTYLAYRIGVVDGLFSAVPRWTPQ